MNNLDTLLDRIKTTPENVEFNDVINVIEEYYDYSPTLFKNGIETDGVVNQIKENEGSCKIFSFAQLHQLNETQTLNCFGQYYRDEVLNYPDETNHKNIRTFIKYGWDHISFEKPALISKIK